MKENKNGVWISWNENVQHDYQTLYTISSELELSTVIGNSNRIRFFGNKQASSDIAAGTESLVDMRSYDKIVGYNDQERLITIESGASLEKLIDAVEAKGWCIPCLPDINTVTVGGAVATGTHGTSGKLLSEYIYKVRLVKANGEVVEIEEGEELMNAVRVSIGTLGVMTEITFKCEDIYTLHVKEGPQKDSEWLPKIQSDLEQNDFLRILWLPHTDKGYVIKGNKIDANQEIKENPGPAYLKHRRTASKILYKYTHRFPWFTSIANKLLYYGFFSSKKEHKGSLYQATVTKSRGSTLELAEWTIGIDKFPMVFEELKKELKSWKNKSFVHIPMDVRFVKADQAWLSYAYQEDIVTMGCVSRSASTADEYEAFKSVERIFIKHGGKPHWAKRFAAKDAELEKLYPKWNAFKQLRKEMDPTNKFLNTYLKAIFNEKN